MIEAEIEGRVIGRLSAVFEEAGVEGVQFAGSLRVSELKAVEQAGSRAYAAVKAFPRSYQTPTTPACTIDCAVSLTVRADEDYNGTNYLGLCDLLMRQFEKWQKCLDEAHADFGLDGVFDVTGFVLGGGQTAVDASATTFQYTHSFTLYGVVR